MEWVALKDLRTIWFKIMVNHKDDSQLKQRLSELVIAGVVEKAYGPSPGVADSGLHLSGPLYIRRIAKKVPRGTGSGSYHEKRLNGVLGLQAEKRRAQRRLNPPKPTKKLSLDDVRYIQANPHGMNNKKLSEMFGINPQTAKRIRHGYTPKYLRGRLAQSRPEDSQAET